jgi:glycosyltransferase involved in cell wall biosynthesis
VPVTRPVDSGRDDSDARFVPALSIVVPVLNGERYIARSLGELRRWLAASGERAEIVVVDDGSTDGTWEEIRRESDANGAGVPLLTLRNPTNQGKGHAVRRGLERASGELSVFTDADLAYPVENLERIVRRLRAGADLAIASRVHPDSRYITSPEFFRRINTRHAVSRVFNALTRSFVLADVMDTQAGLKGFRREALERVLPRLTLERFSFDVEVLVVAKRLGLVVEEVPVTFVYCHEPSTLELSRDGAQMLADLWRIRRRVRRGRYD